MAKWRSWSLFNVWRISWIGLCRVNLDGTTSNNIHSFSKSSNLLFVDQVSLFVPNRRILWSHDDDETFFLFFIFWSESDFLMEIKMLIQPKWLLKIFINSYNCGLRNFLNILNWTFIYLENPTVDIMVNKLYELYFKNINP